MPLALFGGDEPSGESFRDRLAVDGPRNVLLGLGAWALADWTGFGWLRNVAVGMIGLGTVQIVVRAVRVFRRSRPDSLTSLTDEQYARRVAERAAANGGE